jgi:hypothetical protein
MLCLVKLSIGLLLAALAGWLALVSAAAAPPKLLPPYVTTSQGSHRLVFGSSHYCKHGPVEPIPPDRQVPGGPVATGTSMCTIADGAVVKYVPVRARQGEVATLTLDRRYDSVNVTVGRRVTNLGTGQRFRWRIRASGTYYASFQLTWRTEMEEYQGEYGLPLQVSRN